MSFGSRDGSHPVLHRGRLAVASPASPAGPRTTVPRSTEQQESSDAFLLTTSQRRPKARARTPDLDHGRRGRVRGAELHRLRADRLGGVALRVPAAHVRRVRRVRAARRDARRPVRPQARDDRVRSRGRGRASSRWRSCTSRRCCSPWGSSRRSSRRRSGPPRPRRSRTWSARTTWRGRTACSQIGGNAGIMLGPALGGVLLAAIGPGMVFGLNAFSFVVSAAIIATVRGRFAGGPERARRRAPRVPRGLRVHRA